jgi:nuclear GTP-binding protein
MDPASEPTHPPRVDQSQPSDSSPDGVSPAHWQKTKEQMRRHYVCALHKIIDESDNVILVLDARDLEGCRSRLVEEEVRGRGSAGNKLVFVLNKIGVRTLAFSFYFLARDAV